MLENSKGTLINGQSKGIDNAGYTCRKRFCFSKMALFIHIYINILSLKYCLTFVFLSNLNEINHLNKGNNKLPNSEQSYKGKVKTHNYINRQNQSTTGKL